MPLIYVKSMGMSGFILLIFYLLTVQMHLKQSDTGSVMGKSVSEAIHMDLGNEGKLGKRIDNVEFPYHLNPWMPGKSSGTCRHSIIG